jgi:hypothetical protein
MNFYYYRLVSERLHIMTRYKLPVYLFCQFFRIVFLKIHFGSGDARIRTRNDPNPALLFKGFRDFNRK